MVPEFQSGADCVDVSPVEPESLEEYVKTMQIDQEVIDLTGQSEINENMLDANAIAPERADLWLGPDEEDPDCQIIDDTRPEKPRPTPPLENDSEGEDEPMAQPPKMEALLTSPITLRQL
jgi:hypothetical protein